MLESGTTLAEKATELDKVDPLARFRDEFHLPCHNGQPQIYFTGNSLGLQPKRTRDFLQRELDAWAELAVRGHFEGDWPWMPYHEFLTEPMARLVGANSSEVVTMNSLTTNLHLMMATFYRPTPERHRILMESHSFPSDYHAVQSQVRFHGYDPESAIVKAGHQGGVAPPDDEPVDHVALEKLIRDQGERLAMILLPGVQYYTGQVLDIPRIVAAARAFDIPVGVDLAHAVGNVELSLHEWEVDFGVWCSYKYLNSGPGSVGGCFVHDRHATNVGLRRFAGWWGHEKSTRFEMKNEFRAIPTAEGWQLSNPPILSLAAIRASLSVFEEAGWMPPLVEKSNRLSGFLEECLNYFVGDAVEIITPRARGSQLSMRIRKPGVSGQEVRQSLADAGVETDWREPNVIRAAPAPLYNQFRECYEFARILRASLDRGSKG